MISGKIKLHLTTNPIRPSEKALQTSTQFTAEDRNLKTQYSEVCTLAARWDTNETWTAAESKIFSNDYTFFELTRI